MSEFILFWLARHLVDLTIILIIIVVAWLASLRPVIRQSECQHNGAVTETQACDAICCRCGKNLGFIGTWREKKRVQEKAQ